MVCSVAHRSRYDFTVYLIVDISSIFRLKIYVQCLKNFAIFALIQNLSDITYERYN